jgi:hypothetical protein
MSKGQSTLLPIEPAKVAGVGAVPEQPECPAYPAHVGPAAGRFWWAQVVSATARSWHEAGKLLLAGAVLPALPAAGIIASVAVSAQIWADRDNTRQLWAVPLIFAGLLLPLVIAGGNIVARSWAGTAWLVAAQAGGQPASWRAGFEAGRYASRRVWAAYLIGVGCLLVIVTVAANVMTDDTLVRTIATSVGPAGLLGPLILLAPKKGGEAAGWQYRTALAPGCGGAGWPARGGRCAFASGQHRSPARRDWRDHGPAARNTVLTGTGRRRPGQPPW